MNQTRPITDSTQDFADLLTQVLAFDLASLELCEQHMEHPENLTEQRELKTLAGINDFRRRYAIAFNKIFAENKLVGADATFETLETLIHNAFKKLLTDDPTRPFPALQLKLDAIYSIISSDGSRTVLGNMETSNLYPFILLSADYCQKRNVTLDVAPVQWLDEQLHMLASHYQQHGGFLKTHKQDVKAITQAEEKIMASDQKPQEKFFAIVTAMKQALDKALAKYALEGYPDLIDHLNQAPTKHRFTRDLAALMQQTVTLLERHQIPREAEPLWKAIYHIKDSPLQLPDQGCDLSQYDKANAATDFTLIKNQVLALSEKEPGLKPLSQRIAKLETYVNQQVYTPPEALNALTQAIHSTVLNAEKKKVNLFHGSNAVKIKDTAVLSTLKELLQAITTNQLKQGHEAKLEK